MPTSGIPAEVFVAFSPPAAAGYMVTQKKRQRMYVRGGPKVKGRFSPPLDGLGGIDDVPCPHSDDGNHEAPGMQGIVATFKGYGKLTYHEIARLYGLSLNAVRKSGFLDALIALVRIDFGDWRRSSCRPVSPVSPVSAHGPGHAQPNLPSPTSAPKHRHHRALLRISAQRLGLSSANRIAVSVAPKRSRLIVNRPRSTPLATPIDLVAMPSANGGDRARY